MISQTIKETIERKAPEIFNNNLFFQKAQRGEFNKEHLAIYLYNLMHVFKKTTDNLSLAAEVSKQKGLNELADFMSNKITEERGHDQWAVQDLRKHFGERYDVELDRLKLTDETVDVLMFTEEMIKTDPRFYLSYMTFVEYFTILVAPALFKALEEKCNITKAQLTAIANHEEADQHHAAEDFEVIEKYVNDPELLEPMMKILEQSMVKVGRSLESYVQ